MKLLRKSFQIIAILGLVLGVVPKTQALGDLEGDTQLIYNKLIDGINFQVFFCTIQSDFIGTVYKIYTNNLDESINFALFTVFKESGDGYLSELHIEQKERKKNYGALLYSCAIKKMIDLGCKKIKWTAQPPYFDFQTQQLMLPKLIKFYQQLGAKTIHVGVNAASMTLTDFEEARAGIYKILEQWESKSSIEVNNNKALQRAAAIVNHIAPK